MINQVKATPSFPCVQLQSHCGGLPVEVALIAQLGVGAGDGLIQGVMARQRAHAAFVDELEEPSARIGGINLARGDLTSLYTFLVGSGGHPFHRHAGHRVFTAVSGSAGALLRFSTAFGDQVDEDPQVFIDALRQVSIPPDCLFTVRFGGGTWHQFVPLRPGSKNPVLFALSCHTNELGGDLPPAIRSLVEANSADIPSLTETLPESVQRILGPTVLARIPTTALSLHASPVSMAGRLCAATRRWIGPWRSLLARWRSSGGFLSSRNGDLTVTALERPPSGSLLLTQLADSFDHEDSFSVTIPTTGLETSDAGRLLAAVLEGFLENRAYGVSWLMAVRNALVKPLRLRTSPLGCPASSLLSTCTTNVFSGKYPVLAQQVDPNGLRAQVVLGADDRHLRFRSCVGVVVSVGGTAKITLGTRVQTLNTFGRFYMAVIDFVHRHYISPTMLRLAVEHAVQQLQQPEVAIRADA